MKKLNYISFFAAAALAFSSCESDIDNYMVDDTVGLLNSGLIETEVYTGVTDPYKLYVIKAGKGFNSASASLEVDPTVLDEYNLANPAKQLAQLPADAYTVAVADITLTNEDYRVPFVIDWNAQALTDALAADPNLVIPVRMNVTTDGRIADDRLTALIKPTLVEPIVGLVKKQSGFVVGEMPTRKTAEEIEIYFKVEANFIAQRDIAYDLEIDPALMDDYNRSHGTDYVILPSEAFDLQMSGTIKQYLSSDLFRLAFHRNAIIPNDGPSKFGNYMLPIRIKSLSESNINPDRSYVLYAIQVIPVEIDKSKWSVIEVSSSLADEPSVDEKTAALYDASKLIDGDKASYWRTAFSEDQPLPHFFTIDFGQERDLFRFEAYPPSTRAVKPYANNKAGYVEVSLDCQSWTRVGNWTAETGTSTISAILDPCTARYARFVVTEVAENGKVVEKVNIHNATAIAEITFWGE